MFKGKDVQLTISDFCPKFSEGIMCFISILKLSYIFPKDIISQNEHNFHLFGVVDECGAVLGSLPPGDGVVEGRVRGVAPILRRF